MGVAVHICNPSVQEAEAGESEVYGHSQLHKKFKASLNYKKIFSLKIIDPFLSQGPSGSCPCLLVTLLESSTNLGSQG